MSLLRAAITSLIIAISLRAGAQSPAADEEELLNRPVQREVLPEGPALMEDVIARLPRERREIRARLLTRSESGPDRECRAEAVLHFGGHPPASRYLLLDGLGGALEKLEIVWAEDGRPSYAHFQGPDLTPNASFQPSRAVNGLDFNWSDLSLSFLWWRGAEVRGTEQAKLRKCYVVDIPAPPGERDNGAKVRLWIDAKERLMVKAAVLDDADKTLRLIEVDSLKKMGDTWMVKDLDIENLQTGSRTRVRVDEMK